MKPRLLIIALLVMTLITASAMAGLFFYSRQAAQITGVQKTDEEAAAKAAE